MANVGSVSAELNLDLTKFRKSLGEATKLLHKFGQQFGKSFKIDVNVGKNALLPIVKLLGQIRTNTSNVNLGFTTMGKGAKATMLTTEKGLVLINKQLMQTTGLLGKISKKRGGLHMYPEDLKKGYKSVAGVLSPEWFKARAIWFAQLRLTWTSYQGAVRALSSVADFHQSMAQLRGITQASNKEMEQLGSSIRRAAVATKFFASDAAKVATVLAQMGFSAEQVSQMLTPISVLASATGRELQQTGDLVATVMKSWGVSAEDTDKVVNALAAGISSSRLQIEDLAVSFKYLASIMPQMGFGLEKTIAYIGLLRERGLDASMAGTALRRLFTILTKETPRFSKVLEANGLQFADVSLQSNTLDESLAKLRASGISVTEIFSSVQTRGASMLATLIDLIPQVHELEQKITGTNRAYEMNQESMKGVQSRMGQLWSKIEDVTVALTDGGEAWNVFYELALSAIQVIGSALLGLKLVVDSIFEAFITLWVTISTSAEEIFAVLKTLWNEGWDAAVSKAEVSIDVIGHVIAIGLENIKKSGKSFMEAYQNLMTISPRGGAKAGPTEPKGWGLPIQPDEIEDGELEETLDESKNAIKAFYEEIDRIRAESSRRMSTLKAGGIGLVSPETGQQLKTNQLREQVDLIKKQLDATSALLAQEQDLGGSVEYVKNQFARLRGELELTNAELKEQERLASRTFGEGFLNGIENAQNKLGTFADMTQKAGGQIHGILVDTIASGLTTMQDSLADNEHSWKDWARAALQSIRDVINQLLALYVVKQLLGFAMSSGGGSGNATGAPAANAGAGTTAAYGNYLAGRTGGVFPSFKRFAGGGLTSGPAFAILGDNASGKELVIPSENISRDRVEGHVRDKDGKGDLNIVNVTDPNQIYGLMGAVRGQQLIVNAISYDVGRHGPTYRTLKGVR